MKRHARAFSKKKRSKGKSLLISNCAIRSLGMRIRSNGLIRSLELDNSFSRIAIIIRYHDLYNSLSRIAFRSLDFNNCNPRERIVKFEGTVFNPRERIV